MSMDSLSAAEIGRRIVDGVNELKFLDVIEELYSADVVSIEAMGSPEAPAEVSGIEAIRGKNKWWLENHNVHSVEAKGPFPHGDRVAVFYRMEMTPMTGARKDERTTFEEVAIYTIEDGKVVREEFFYAT
jgi:hypothetical protein